MKNKHLTIKDLYASNDFIKGLEAGKKIPPTLIIKIIPERNEPIEIDKHTWFYIDKTKISIVHEIYIDNKYIRTDQFSITKKSLVK